MLKFLCVFLLFNVFEMVVLLIFNCVLWGGSVFLFPLKILPFSECILGVSFKLPGFVFIGHFS